MSADRACRSRVLFTYKKAGAAVAQDCGALPCLYKVSLSQMTHAAQLLDRLERVKSTAPGRWLARCPAHEDRSPSLSIREKDDGTILINCFAGCSALSILDAVQLPWNALFPHNTGSRIPTAPSRSRIPAVDLLKIISLEASVIATVGADLLARKMINETDWKRLSRAVARVGKAYDLARQPLR